MGATVIDELVVSLKLDPTNFIQGQKSANEALGATERQSEKFNKQARESGLKTADVFNKVKNGIFALTGAFIGLGAIKSFVTDTTRADASLGRLGRNLSIATADLKAFEGVGARYGSSAEDMDAAFQHTADVIADFRNRGYIDPSFLFNLGMLQVDSAKFFDSATNDIERFKMVQESLNRSVESGLRTREQALRLGMGLGYSQETITMMIETKNVLDDLIAKQKEMNAVTESDTMLAQARSNAWKDLTNTFEGFGRTLLNILTSSMLSGADRFSIAKQISDEQDKRKKLPEWMGGKSAKGWSQEAHGTIARGSAPPTASGGESPSEIAAYQAQLEKQYGLPKGVLAAVRAQESSNRTGRIVSPAGAIGPMQFMPKTAAAYGVADPNDLRQSLAGAAHLLHDLLQRFHGDLGMALAGYNMNPDKVAARYPANLPLETRRYVPGVMSRMPGGNTTTTSTHINNVNIYAQNDTAQDLAGILHSGDLSRYNTNLQSMPGQK